MFDCLFGYLGHVLLKQFGELICCNVYEFVHLFKMQPYLAYTNQIDSFIHQPVPVLFFFSVSVNCQTYGRLSKASSQCPYRVRTTLQYVIWGVVHSPRIDFQHRNQLALVVSATNSSQEYHPQLNAHRIFLFSNVGKPGGMFQGTFISCQKNRKSEQLYSKLFYWFQPRYSLLNLTYLDLQLVSSKATRTTKCSSCNLPLNAKHFRLDYNQITIFVAHTSLLITVSTTSSLKLYYLLERNMFLRQSIIQQHLAESILFAYS